MALIFALWSQCRTREEAEAFAAHFEDQCWVLSHGFAGKPRLKRWPETCTPLIKGS